MTNLDLEEIRARVNAATPGPWGVGNGTNIVRGLEVTGPGSYTCIQSVAEVSDYRCDWDRDEAIEIDPEDDAEFIAHARTDVPALLDYVKHIDPIINASPVLAEIAAERGRQDAKWGEQNHPDGTGPDVVWAFTGPASYVAESARAECNRLHAEGYGTWRDILTEEIAEAYAESDPAKLRTELIQVAAVATAWVECIDRRGGESQ